MAKRAQSYSPSAVRIYDFLKSSRVSLQMLDAPNVLKDQGFELSRLRDLQFLCEAVEIPGKSLATTEFKLSGYNRAKVPVLRANPEINLILYQSSKEFPTYEFFTSWIELAAPRDHVVSYYDDIVVREGIDLIQWTSQENDANFIVRLYNAFPISVGSLQGNWGDDGFQRINVTFTFEESEIIDGSNSNSYANVPDRKQLLDLIEQTDNAFTDYLNRNPIEELKIQIPEIDLSQSKTATSIFGRIFGKRGR